MKFLETSEPPISKKSAETMRSGREVASPARVVEAPSIVHQLEITVLSASGFGFTPGVSYFAAVKLDEMEGDGVKSTGSAICDWKFFHRFLITRELASARLNVRLLAGENFVGEGSMDLDQMEPGMTKEEDLPIHRVGGRRIREMGSFGVTLRITAPCDLAVVQVNVDEGKHLKARAVRKTDAYLKLWLEGTSQHAETAVIHSLNPKWNEQKLFWITRDSTQVLRIELWESNMVRSDDYICSVSVELTDAALVGRGVARVFTLEEGQAPHKKHVGELHFTFHIEPFAQAPGPMSGEIPAEGEGGGLGGREGERGGRSA
jgi:hypothetical protein